MQKYEVMIVFKPLLFDDIKNNAIKKIKEYLDKSKAQLNEIDNVGKKLLAYPIKKFKEGYYVEYELVIDQAEVNKFKRFLNLNSEVLRSLIIKK